MNVDGLSTSDLERSRAEWWDRRFTRLLLDAVPPDAVTLIDVGCGVATAAHALLPERKKLAYLGVDVDEERLAQAQLTFEGTSYQRRVTLRRAEPFALPVPEAVAEVVLFVLTLQHQPNAARVLVEAKRALVPGGRVVAIEPDNRGSRFGFDGALDQVSRAFAELLTSTTANDASIGPRVPRLLDDAGLRVTDFVAHAVQVTREESSTDFKQRMHSMADAVARASSPALDRFRAAVDAVPEVSRGWSSHVVPCFLTVGLRTES